MIVLSALVLTCAVAGLTMMFILIRTVCTMDFNVGFYLYDLTADLCCAEDDPSMF